MKKTVKINLSGIVFTLDEDAYHELKNYLDSISSRFRDMKEGNEIISDIESRIAEIFQSKVNDKKEVITIEDVNDVISIMGKPEDFYEAEEEDFDSSTKKTDYTRKENRRLYRDPENAIFGGVAAGLAAYFGISADGISMKITGCPLSVKGLYNLRMISSAFSDSMPTTIRSGLRKSSTAAPSLRNSGLEATSKGISTPLFANSPLMASLTRIAVPTGTVLFVTTRR